MAVAGRPGPAQGATDAWAPPGDRGRVGGAERRAAWSLRGQGERRAGHPVFGESQPWRARLGRPGCRVRSPAQGNAARSLWSLCVHAGAVGAFGRAGEMWGLAAGRWPLSWGVRQSPSPRDARNSCLKHVRGSWGHVHKRTQTHTHMHTQPHHIRCAQPQSPPSKDETYRRAGARAHTHTDTHRERHTQKHIHKHLHLHPSTPC